MACLVRPTVRPSELARRRLIGTEGAPLFLSDWTRAVFLHYRVAPEILCPQVPYELDTRDGWAYVSLVAFEMLRLRPRAGGRCLEWLSSPIGNHGFLNVRTYVRHQREPGIYFLVEWLPNRLSVSIGRRLFGLPYRFAELDYHHDHKAGTLFGSVAEPRRSASLRWDSGIDSGPQFVPCEPHSLDEFLLERYTAFTERHGVQRLFRVWHEPWPQTRLDVTMRDVSLLRRTGDWIEHAQWVGANYSPGVREVWVGRPQRMRQD